MPLVFKAHGLPSWTDLTSFIYKTQQKPFFSFITVFILKIFSLHLFFFSFSFSLFFFFFCCCLIPWLVRSKLLANPSVAGDVGSKPLNQSGLTSLLIFGRFKRFTNDFLKWWFFQTTWTGNLAGSLFNRSNRSSFLNTASNYSGSYQLLNFVLHQFSTRHCLLHYLLGTQIISFFIRKKTSFVKKLNGTYKLEKIQTIDV